MFLSLTAFGLAAAQLAPAPRPATPSEITAVVAGLQGRYLSVTSMRADFEQTYRGPGIQQTESGTLYMKKPGLMRWEYRDPEVKLFIADGRETYLYTPEDRQVLVSRFSTSELHSTPLQFLLGHGNILDSYAVSWESEIRARVEGTALIRLLPRKPDPTYDFLVIECDDRTFDLRRIVIREKTGNTSEFLLTNLQTNVSIEDKRFQFNIPKGAEVIRLDQR